MNDFLYALDSSLDWSIRLYWLPMLAWTVLTSLAMVLLSSWKRLHPRLQLDLRMAMLLALPAGIAVMALTEIRLPANVETPVQEVIPQVFLPVIQTAYAAPSAAMGTPWLALTALMAAGFALAYGLWLGYQALALFRLHRQEGREVPGWLEAEARELAERFGIRRSVRIFVSQRISIPCTYGWRNPVVILPQALLQDRPSLHMALVHEILHVRRHDYAWRWAERVATVFFGINPLVWILRRQIDHLREIVCDNEVVCLDPAGAGDYARLLVSFSPVLPNRLVVSVGMAEGAVNLKRRISTMKQHILHVTKLIWLRRTSMALALLTLVAGSLVVAGTEALARTGEALEVKDLTDAVEKIPAPVTDLLALQTADTESVTVEGLPVAGVNETSRQITVRGTVRNTSGAPIVGAHVVDMGRSTTRSDGAVTYVSTKTISDGTFVLENVTEGSDITVVADGYSSSVRQATENMTFVLRPRQVQPQTETMGRPRTSNDTVYVIVEQMPSFPGGTEALRSYISENFKTPELAKRAGVQGRVFVTFVIEKDGSVTDPQVARGIGAGCDEEAVRLVNAMPKWNPGQQAGQPKAVRYSIPVSCNP